MTDHEPQPLWTPRKVGEMTRYYRDGAGTYSLRRVMDPAPAGKPQRRKWVLYSGERRIWDVQPEGTIKSAVAAAEAWLSGA